MTTPPRTQSICPSCGAAIAKRSPAFPFCSDRCKALDLGNWLTERYAVAGTPVTVETSDDDEEGGSSDPRS